MVNEVKIFSMPSIVLLSLIALFFFGDNLSLEVKSNLYSISLLLKNGIVFLLPFVIISLVATGVQNLRGSSVSVIFLLVLLVCTSNFLGFWLSYFITVPLLKSGFITISKLNPSKTLSPSWLLEFSPIMKNDVALLIGIALGLLSGFSSESSLLKTLVRKFRIVSSFILKSVISPILPVFILGFIVKLQHEGSLSLIIREYSVLLLIIAISTYGYMFFVVFLSSNMVFSEAIRKFKNMVPSILLGLFSMSSAAAIPSTIRAGEENVEDKELVRFVVPSTANMHLLGDCFSIPIIGLAVISSFGFEIPSIGEYLVFALNGVVAKFAAAGIPGGSAIIFAPIFEDVFGFSAQMLTAVTTIYVLFDPVATSSNVFGHGMFVILFEKVYKRFKRVRG